MLDHVIETPSSDASEWMSRDRLLLASIGVNETRWRSDLRVGSFCVARQRVLFNSHDKYQYLWEAMQSGPLPIDPLAVFRMMYDVSIEEFRRQVVDEEIDDSVALYA